MLKRGFKGDTGVFEAAVSEDGKVMVVLDTRKDEKVRTGVRRGVRRVSICSCRYVGKYAAGSSSSWLYCAFRLTLAFRAL